MSAKVTLRTLKINKKGNNMKNESAKAVAKAKAPSRRKISFFLKTELEEKLMKLFVKRLGEDLRTKKSYLIEEAIELLLKAELDNKQNQPRNYTS